MKRPQLPCSGFQSSHSTARRRSRHLARPLCATFLTASVLLAALFGSASAAPLRQGPAGAAFYTPPPNALSAGHHGSLIWARPLLDSAAFASASKNWLILYRSTDASGNPVVVSGTVAIPRGKPPVGGWPVISWAHGTTGVANICAPSREGMPNVPKNTVNPIENVYLSHWLERGYAVLKTDYQGLGTPGLLPYMVGEDAARDATDIVYAARQLDPQLGKNWVVMGHSEGGGTALYTAYLGPIYGQGLHLKAAVALSPYSHIAMQMQYAESHRGTLQAYPEIPSIFLGAKTAAPGIDLSSLLTPIGKKVMEKVNALCTQGMGKYLKTHNVRVLGQLFKTSANFVAINNIIARFDDVGNIRPSVPLLIVQADNDYIVRKQFTDMTVRTLNTLGAGVTYHVIHVTDKGKAPTNHQATIPETRAYVEKWTSQWLPPTPGVEEKLGSNH